ncbi:hypothetical protein N9Y42_02470 [Mariniblastus sp.]|nr:hypothetical protein [Mariniblastus sp.]
MTTAVKHFAYLALPAVLFLSACNSSTETAEQTSSQQKPSSSEDVSGASADQSNSSRSTVFKDQATIDAASELVRKEIQSFDDQIRSEEELDRLAALNAMLPKKEHFVELFGAENGRRLWDWSSPRLDELRKNSGLVKAQIEKRGAITKIDVINLRDTEAENFEMLPASVPLFRAKTLHEDGNSAGSSTYLVIDGDVIMIRGLEDFPVVLETILHEK